MWVTNREADTVGVIEASNLEVVAEVKAAASPIRAAFTLDGARAGREPDGMALPPVVAGKP